MNRSRNVQLKLYINEQEQTELDNMMKSYAGTKSQYVRDCIFKTNALDLQLFNENITELIKQYKAIGNNLNQITRAMHQGQIDIDKKEIEDMRKELEKLWQLLKSLKVGEV